MRDAKLDDLVRSMGLDDPQRAEQALTAARGELAKQSLLDFAPRVSPWFQAPRHIVYLADLLERVDRGEIRRLAISVAPGHGKSTLLQHFVAFFLGRSPGRRVLALSASEALAQRNSRAIRGIVQSDGWPWPEIGLEGAALEEWHVRGGGGLRAIGVGGTLTGYRAELVLCDDVQPDAGSSTTRKTLEDWFREVLSTRLEPTGSAVLINTRWHDDDLVGRLQSGDSADLWTFVNIAAIAGENDPLGRAPGEALWPERWPVELLKEKRSEVGSSAFSAQYQGDPAPAEGRMFHPTWLEHRYDAVPTVCAIPRSYEAQVAELKTGRPARSAVVPIVRLQAVDCAAKTGLSNDRTAIATIATDLKDFYIENVWLGRVDYPGLRRVVAEQFERYRPRVVYVESASNGSALIDDLRSSTSLPIASVIASDSKELRAQAVTGLFEAGRVKFPNAASWLSEVLSEFSRFPAGKHDDAVDAIIWAVLMAQKVVLRAQSDQRHATQMTSLRRAGFMSR
jgi:predicted phage terminase large subunit-like protein